MRSLLLIVGLVGSLGLTATTTAEAGPGYGGAHTGGYVAGPGAGSGNSSGTGYGGYRAGYGGYRSGFNGYRYLNNSYRGNSGYHINPKAPRTIYSNPYNSSPAHAPLYRNYGR